MGRDATEMVHHHQEPSSPGVVVLQQKDHYSPSVRLLNIPKLQNGACGFNLSRSKWDPYPWVSAVQ